MSAKSIRVVIAVMVAVLIVPLAAVQSAAPAWAVGTLGLTQQLSYNGTAGNALSIPAGDQLILAMNYSCGGENCLDAKITAPIPAGLAIGGISVVSGASSSVAGNVVTVTLPANLPAGSAGQITVTLTVPAWTTANGTTFSWQSTMRATGAVDAVSNSVTLTASAASTTNAALTLNSGGTLDEPLSYTAQVCVQAAAGASAVAVDAGSVATVTLPTGATFVSAASGGVYSAGTITWTLGQLSGCAGLGYVISYDSATTSAGATKTTNLSWSGHYLGETGTTLLGTATLSTTIAAPSVGIGFDKWSFQNTAAVDTGVTYFLAMSNTGNTTADEVVFDDTIPDPMQVTGVSASAPSVGTTPGEIWISSRRGPDGVLNTGDDGVLVLAASIPVNGSAGVGIYGSGTWPSGAAQLPPGDVVKRVVVKLFDVGPGQSGDRVAIGATVMPQSFDGVTTLVGDTVTNTADFSYHVLSGAVDQSASSSDSHVLTIAPQITTITTSLGGGGVLAPGVTQQQSTIGLGVNPFALKNPVVTLVLPAMVSLVTWAPSSTTVLPTPTLTVVAGWAGSTSTLYRWTYPVGTTLAAGSGYSIDYTLELDDEAWGAQRVRAYGSSATDPYYCTWNFFEGGPDIEDKDGDGDVTEVLCNWSFDVSPAPSTAAALTVAVDSSYSTGFATGTAYTGPGGTDTYRLSMRNAGTLPLNQVTVVAVLPRAQDLYTLSAAQRNPALHTFPVVLTGAASAPALATAPIVYYTTQALPCLPELSYSAAGCTAAGWTSVLPGDPSTVTAVRVDFGSNTLNPFVTWNIDLPVTTPTTGASEPLFAEINPDPTQPGNDERAAGSAAFTALTQSATSLTAESSVVSLVIPGIDGAPGVPPVVVDLSSTGIATAPQTAQPTMPTGGEAFLLDGSTEVTTLTIAGEGIYSIDPATGEITFVPQLGFSGAATAVNYRVRNSFAASADAQYAPTVTLPVAPTAPDLSSTAAFGTRAQSVMATIPASGSIRLIGSGGAPVTTVTVAGEGQYTVDPATGEITFTALAAFGGIPTPISYRITDAYGQSATALYEPGVVLALPSLASTGVEIVAISVSALLLLVAGAAIALGRRRDPLSSVV